MTNRSLYEEALDWINRNPGAGGTVRLVKLLLSFWNGVDYPFTFSDCVAGLDDHRSALTVRIAAGYARDGETEELRQVFYDLPMLAQQGFAARDAMYELRRVWERERLYPNG